MKYLNLFATSLILTLLFGCAASYNHVNPTSLDYDSHGFSDGIGFSYQYDALISRGNKKYANKEDKKGVRLVAVKITNNTDESIIIGQTAKLYANNNEVILMSPEAIKKSIGQVVPGYLPYLLLTFTNLYITNNQTTTTYPIGVVLGPGVTIGNMAMAGSSNKKLLSELIQYDLRNKPVASGETVHGIIGIYSPRYSSISIKAQ